MCRHSLPPPALFCAACSSANLAVACLSCGFTITICLLSLPCHLHLTSLLPLACSSQVQHNFKSIQSVPTAKDFIDIVLSKTQRGTPTVVHNGACGGGRFRARRISDAFEHVAPTG
jgi:hypothetical protein